MFRAVSEARKSIYLEMYIFDNEMEEYDFFTLLQKKARQGLRVKMVIDYFGSLSLSNKEIAELKASGVEVLSLSHLFYRMHRKILIVDEQVAFIGGVNIYRASRFWNDLMVEITGSLVKKIVLSFAKSYRGAGGRDPLFIGDNDGIVRTIASTWIVEHSPVGKKFQLKRIYKKYLHEAISEIILVTPYFIPKRWLRAALHQAVLRGVRVEILIPSTAEHFFLDRLNYFYIYKLSKLGVVFYMLKKTNHAKAMIIDGKEAMVGSPNLDFLSFDFNSEIGIFFKEKEAVAKLSRIVRVWKKDAVLFDHKTYKPKWFDYILSPIINMLSLFYRLFVD